MRPRLAPSPAAAIAFVALVAALGGAAFAGGSSGNEINGCYKDSNGRLRLVDDRSECRRGERSIGWNRGGSRGPAGPPGVSGYELVREASDLDDSAKGVTVRCPEGKKVLGGGGLIADEDGNQVLGLPVAVTQSVPVEPASAGGRYGWSVFAQPLGPAGDWKLVARAACARAPGGSSLSRRR